MHHPRLARLISPDGPPIKIAVVPTNEELAIARESCRTLLECAATDCMILVI